MLFALIGLYRANGEDHLLEVRLAQMRTPNLGQERSLPGAISIERRLSPS